LVSNLVKRGKMKKKNKRGFDFKKEYKLSWDFLKESKNYIYSVIAIFFGFALIGYFMPVSDSFRDYVLKFLQELLMQTEGLSQFEMINFIFWNNIQSGFMGMIFGFALGVFPVLATLANGYFLGFVASLVVGESGLSILWKLVPHGIFELPAIFISYGMGMKFGSFAFEKKKLEKFKEYFWNSLRVFILVVLPLLVIAAVIEGSLISLLG